jgi:sterol desaturase/sphingolipid hydroxylase (fatty acid hydroxylase superfamily)/creatinine amidohydrolase/Fe(II)-dependent formamide hydrolase-like protein
MFHPSLPGIINNAEYSWFGIFIPQERIFILYLFTSLFMAWLVWRAEMRNEAKENKKGFISYVFDPALYKHKSSWQDYFIFFANGILHYGIIAQFILTERPFAITVRRTLLAAFGPVNHPLFTGLAGLALFSFVWALLYDLGVYLAHYMTHKIPALWAFHKVHHSAEVLTPVTLLRMHPVDLFLNSILVAVLAGAGIGIFSYLTLQEITDVKVLGINIILFLFYFFGYNLRHSHVWLHYPKWLSRFLISPAQHQIHHSIALPHRDKNLGLIFSFWDKLFGTLYLPEKKESLVYGISAKEPNPYSSLKEMYMKPFIECRDLFRKRLQKKGVNTLFRVAGTLAGCVGFVLLYLQMATLANGGLMDPPSVYIEDLTWPEIYQAQHNGYDTIIIPSGGTEQNGPHMVLGKHNYIARYTAGEIAKRLGNALVAPVIAYVPEGEITPKLTENMRQTGTIGVPPQVLEDTLYWAAFSFKQHGFRHIYFIGDHGFDQVPQQHVADKLTALWKKDGVIVANISKYYDPSNEQVHWLEKHGFKDKDIGFHASIRDTSELMYVHPEGIRHDPITIPGMPSGVWGNPVLATKDIGEKMIELKVSAAVKEINDIRLTGKAPPAPYDIKGP